MRAMAKQTLASEAVAHGYPFRVSFEDGVYVIEVPDLPGCVTVAQTSDDILPMVTDAVMGWLEAAAELGRPAPSPGGAGMDEYLAAVAAERRS